MSEKRDLYDKTKNNRKIYLKECLTYAEPNGFTKEIINVEEATLATKEAGNGSTFDKIVIFEGEKHPKSLIVKKKILNILKIPLLYTMSVQSF